MKNASHRRMRVAWGVALALLITGGWSQRGLAQTADLDQCRNGSAGSPSNCIENGNTGWVNGNAGASGAHYLETLSIPYRVVMTGLPSGQSITITLGYDIKHSGKHAIDFLTHYDRLEPHFQFGHPKETVDPTSGVSVTSALTTTFTIPAPSATLPCAAPVAEQPTAAFNALSAAEKNMTLFGGTITGIAYVSQGCLTASQAETRISVTFNVPVDNATAVLAFGGHIASANTWNGQSAAAISGSPYHMRLENWTLGSLGNQDRSLSASAVLDPCAGVTCTSDACETRTCVNGLCVPILSGAGTLCRSSEGVCDVAEYCDGINSNCPADAKVPLGTLCRGSGGVCDVAEFCNGTSNTCPADGFQPNTTVCREAAGVCDVAEMCTGNSASCPADTLRPSNFECRASAGVCDIAEKCTGTSAACPADDFRPSNFECRASAGICDVAETCTGSSAICPADNFRPSNFECRASAGICDVAETCTGSSAACPADTLRPNGFGCRASAGVCDIAETCTGSSAACPADVKSTAMCRTAAGACDVAEFCNGVNDDCPGNSFVSAGTVCRAAAGQCDIAETCTGNSAACPADAKSTGMCRAAAGACDLAEFCDGRNNTCPGDILRPGGYVCRTSAGVCDVAESCTGTSAACPADTLRPPGFECRPSVAACDLPEYCSGLTVSCPGDGFVAAGTQCRDGDGLCNPAEMCTGTSSFCPGDITFVPNPDTCNLSGLGVCRTAGFWGTHGGTEKNKSINITQAVINFHLNSMLPGGPLNVCGEKINTTSLNDAASALEALCVSVQGNQRLQLTRQLTAAALNCAVSGYYNCEGYPKYQELFSQCNTLCAATTTGEQTFAINYCINAVDCLNNGGTYYHGGTVLADGSTVPAEGYCKTGTCSNAPNIPCNSGDVSLCGSSIASCTPDRDTCHDQPLCLHIDGKPIPGAPCFPETGPAGSTNACNSANKNNCTVIGPGETYCKYDSCNTVDSNGKCVAN